MTSRAHIHLNSLRPRLNTAVAHVPLHYSFATPRRPIYPDSSATPPHRPILRARWLDRARRRLYALCPTPRSQVASQVDRHRRLRLRAGTICHLCRLYQRRHPHFRLLGRLRHEDSPHAYMPLRANKARDGARRRIVMVHRRLHIHLHQCLHPRKSNPNKYKTKARRPPRILHQVEAVAGRASMAYQPAHVRVARGARQVLCLRRNSDAARLHT